MKNKRTLISSSIFLLASLSFACFLIGYQNYLEPKLGDFNILELNNNTETLTLQVEPSHNAVSYEAIIKNTDGEELWKSESESNQIPLKNFLLNYGDEVQVQVFAKNKNNTKKEATNTLKYTWNTASFQNLNGRYIDATKGLSLMLYGYQQNETYILKLEYLNQVIHEEEIQTDNIYIPYQKLEGYAGRITAKLYTEENCLISTYNFYANTPVIGKIKMTSPSEGLRTRWNDINISYEGGENATEYHLLIFEEGTLVNTIVIPKDTKKYTLPANLLKEDKNYNLRIEAVYLDYAEITESDDINIYVGKIETTNPVYVSHNPTFIKSGTEIKLDTRTPNSTIYYTTDGSNPTTESHVYDRPLTIRENVTIKTYAVSQNRFDSAINTYDFQVRDKNLVVYLSPSNQTWNHGNSAAGFTTEMREMNRVADVVERVLKQNGVTVYRNKPTGEINGYLSESNYVKSDLHLAIHSNASSSKEARGIEIYVDSPTSKSLSIATQIYQNLYAIYPANNIPSTNRGVKYANGSLGEANDAFIPCGTLIEVAYHDNYEDAKWILDNMETIGNNIATSILSYYN